MGGNVAVSIFALSNPPNILRSKKAHTLYRGIPGMNMNTETM